MKLFKGKSGDALLLSLIKAFTTVSGIFTTMIASHALSLELYGTYSQTTLIVTTATNLSALGLIDSVNYFYNKNINSVEQRGYVNTAMGIQLICGIFVGVLILLMSKGIITYFNNALLGTYLGWIAFRPLFTNLNGSFQHLLISIDRAKSIAVKNATFALMRLSAFAISVYILRDITVILVSLLLFDLISAVYFGGAFAKQRFIIKPYKIEWQKAKEIFVYCIPMGVYVLTNSIARDIDKMLIGRWCTTEQYAIYANCSTLLPFDIISAAFLTILVPILTRYFRIGDYYSGRKLFVNYLKVGYYTAFTFTCACILLSREMILFLYGEKYLEGDSVFILYTVVDMVKFANMSIVLSACGKTKTLMVCSLVSLIGNVFLNNVLFYLFGYIGPAIATVVITIILTCVLVQMSAKALHTSMLRLLEWKEVTLFIIELLLMGIIFEKIRMLMFKNNIHYLWIILLVGTAYILCSMLLNREKILRAVNEINSLK